MLIQVEHAKEGVHMEGRDVVLSAILTITGVSREFYGDVVDISLCGLREKCLAFIDENKLGEKGDAYFPKITTSLMLENREKMHMVIHLAVTYECIPELPFSSEFKACERCKATFINPGSPSRCAICLHRMAEPRHDRVGAISIGTVLQFQLDREVASDDLK